MKLLIATTNKGKLRELRALFSVIPELEVLSPEDVGPLPTVDEDGDTFAHNAEKKAREYAAASGLPVLADDSGLQVDALDGEPGVHSARYAGETATDADNVQKLLAALDGVPEGQRGARFRAVLVVVGLGDTPIVTQGACEGRIRTAPRGDDGFGYDPVFLPSAPEAAGRTMAELPPEVKNAISHRAKASKKMADCLAAVLATRS